MWIYHCPHKFLFPFWQTRDSHFSNLLRLPDALAQALDLHGGKLTTPGGPEPVRVELPGNPAVIVPRRPEVFHLRHRLAAVGVLAGNLPDDGGSRPAGRAVSERPATLPPFSAPLHLLHQGHLGPDAGQLALPVGDGHEERQGELVQVGDVAAFQPLLQLAVDPQRLLGVAAEAVDLGHHQRGPALAAQGQGSLELLAVLDVLAAADVGELGDDIPVLIKVVNVCTLGLKSQAAVPLLLGRDPVVGHIFPLVCIHCRNHFLDGLTAAGPLVRP